MKSASTIADVFEYEDDACQGDEAPYEKIEESVSGHGFSDPIAARMAVRMASARA